MNNRRLAALALMLAGLAGPLGPIGCATPTDEMLVTAEQVNDLGYTYHWARDLALPSDQHIGDIRVHGDMIVLIEQPENIVWAVSMRDGSVRWHRPAGRVGQRLYGSIRWGEMIHVNSPTRLHFLDIQDGSVVQINELESTVATGPVLYENFAIFGGVNGRVFAHDLNRGFYRWAYQMGGQISTAPVLANRRVFVTDDQGGYAMLNGDDGSLLWRRYTHGPIHARPAVDQRHVYVPSEDHFLYALDIPSGGRDHWVYPAQRPIDESPSVTSDLVLLPNDEQGRFLALNKNDGSERWRLDRPARFIQEREDGRLLLSSDDHLLLVEADTGELHDEIPTRRLHTVLIGPEESIILVSPTGRMLRLNRMP